MVFHVQQGAVFNAMAGIDYAVVMLDMCKTYKVYEEFHLGLL